MFCGNCGKGLPEDANFCLKCGKPQRATLQAEEPRWEFCELRAEGKPKGFSGSITWYWAEAVGPKGRYNAGESEQLRSTDIYSRECRYGDIKKRDNALNKLIQRLTSEGWEPITRGESFYSYRFRRRVTSK